MSISNLGNLKDAVSRWLLRKATDLVVTQEQILNYIALCEAELNRELQIRVLEEAADIATVAAREYVDLPDDFNSVKDLYFTSQPTDIDYFPTRRALINRFPNQTGRPRGYTIQGSKIYFAPAPDAVYALNLDYFKNIPALSDENATNDILTLYPDAYLYGALKQAALQIQDDKRLQTFPANYVAVVGRIQENDAFSRIPTGARGRAKPIG